MTDMAMEAMDLFESLSVWGLSQVLKIQLIM